MEKHIVRKEELGLSDIIVTVLARSTGGNSDKVLEREINTEDNSIFYTVKDKKSIVISTENIDDAITFYNECD